MDERQRLRYERADLYKKVIILTSVADAWTDFLAHPNDSDAYRLNQRRVTADLANVVSLLREQFVAFMENDYAKMKKRGDEEVEDCINTLVSQQERNIRVLEECSAGNIKSTKRAMRYYKQRPERIARYEQSIRDEKATLEKKVAECRELIKSFEAGDISSMAGATHTLDTLERVVSEAREILEKHGENVVLSVKTETVKPAEKVKDVDSWTVWSKKIRAKYRELQNIPENWGVDKVVLIWWNRNEQSIRIFAKSKDSVQTALDNLVGPVSALPHHIGERWDFTIDREQYDKATGE